MSKAIPKEQIDYVRQIAWHRTTEEIRTMLNEKFGTDYSYNQVKALKNNHKIQSGLTGQFEKGHKPWTKGKSIEEIMNLLNKKSGVYGMSGVSSDFRDLEAAANSGNELAKDATEVFVYRVAKYIGSYAAAMNGVDAIAFTAGLGENDKNIRRRICEYLGFIGVEIDEERNNVRGKEAVISSDSSGVKVLAVPTNEELAIARDTVMLVSNR